MNFVRIGNQKLHAVAKGALRILQLPCPLYFPASADTNIISQESGTLTAVSDKRFVIAKLHIQCFTDKLGQFALDFNAVLAASIDPNQEIVSVSDVFDYLIRLRFRRSFLSNSCRQMLERMGDTMPPCGVPL